MPKKPKKSKPNPKIDPNTIKTRDWLLVEVIKGATKAGVHKDKKKENSKKRSRKPIKVDEE